MKKMIKKMSVVLAGLAVIGTSSARAGAVEYKNIIDMDRFVASLEDPAENKFCSAERAGDVVTASMASPETEYRNVTDLERFVAALKDPTSREYRNLMTLERFVAALGEETKATEYRNIINIERFVTALRDSREVEYRNIFDLETFVAALNDNKTEGTTSEIVCKDGAGTPASYKLAGYEVGACI